MAWLIRLFLLGYKHLSFTNEELDPNYQQLANKQATKTTQINSFSLISNGVVPNTFEIIVIIVSASKMTDSKDSKIKIIALLEHKKECIKIHLKMKPNSGARTRLKTRTHLYSCREPPFPSRSDALPPSGSASSSTESARSC